MILDLLAKAASSCMYMVKSNNAACGKIYLGSVKMLLCNNTHKHSVNSDK